MTEKLACGFLKPFLNHLRAVEEQVMAGCESVKLERPQPYHGRSWFTKGTLERFVRFVSTPEVLERVKFIEDELAQLEQVRGIQASSLLQVEDSNSTAEPVYQRNGPMGTFGIAKLAQNYPHDAVESRREASKVELLRAMDVRLLALRQEQSMAFSRAAAAGFSRDNMMDLVAFSEYFGADRLRMACFNFLVVLQQRVMEPMKLNPQAVSNSCGVSVNLSEVSMLPKQEVLPQSNIKSTKGSEADTPNGAHQIKEERRYMINNGVLSITDGKSGFDGIQSREAVGSDDRKRLLLPKNICEELFADQDRIDSALPMQRENSVNNYQRVHSTCRNPSKVSKALSTSEPISLSHLPLEGGSTFDSEGPVNGQELSLNRAPALVLPNNRMRSSIKPVDGTVEEQTDDSLSTVPSAISASARRLSVQDAISLFENKQRKESVEVPRKQHTGKHESGRASLEATNALSSACIGTRRWSIETSNAVGKFLQENLPSSKQGAPTIRSKAVRSDVNVLLPKQEEDGVGLQSKVFLQKGSNVALCQPSLDEMSVKESNNEKQVSGDNALEYESQGPVQFKRGGSIAQGTLSEMLVEQGSLKAESNMTIRPTNFLNIETDGTSLTEIGDKVPEKVGVRKISWEPMAMQDSSVMHASSKGSNAGLEVLPSCDRQQEGGVSEQNGKNSAATVFVVSELATMQSSARKSFERIRAGSLQLDVQNLVQMHSNETQGDADKLERKKGRFYEQYTKLRDAKLKDENDFKKAEREAKLRLMEETLLLRKAELDAQIMKLSMRNHQQTRAIKLHARKADLQALQRAKEDAVDERNKEIRSFSKGRARSPPLTSSSGKEEVSTSKSQGGRKSSVASQKGATPPRSSMRGSSLSPKLTPRSVTGLTMKPRKFVASGVNDNPLAKSVPSFANLRKENTKPLAGCPLGNNSLQAKDGGAGRFCAPSEAQPLETNENIPVCTSVCGPAKEDKVLSLVCRSRCDLKRISTSSDEGASAPLVLQREVGSEPGALSTLTCDDSSQEIQQIANGGETPEQKLGHLTIQQTPSPLVGSLGSYEGRSLYAISLEPERTDGSNMFLVDTDPKDAFGEQSMETDTGESDLLIDSGPPSVLVMRTVTIAAALMEETAVIDAKTAYRTTSFPTDMESAQQFAAGGLLGRREVDSNPHSVSGQNLESLYVADASTCRAVSLPHEHHLPRFSHGPASPPNSQVEVQIDTASGHFSSSLASGVESPVLSPAYWNSLQMQYPPGPQKLATALSNKESAKGFKKLLKFGRKNRAPDAATADWASSYATSEGDDESEDQKYSIDERNAKGKLDECKAVNIKGDQYITADKTLAAQSMRSSIPTPPANFKIRDDQLIGGTMLKAPKSFFSFSSFRSRGTEGRV
ncbi:hypothetical protein GOP47_0014936 [Adiantum capillus-veneris]|uniref:Uncharacterized protein n=1 Tax=Adiantum capillus-veneris TaxID=13818 RepID=A0A9D4UNN4_ADICA|nr:hypothetical protein GOP47_0014936 [Adiantum capillus-veneris]